MRTLIARFAHAYYEKRFGFICPELDWTIRALQDHLSPDVDEALAHINMVFEMEWGFPIDEYYEHQVEKRD